MTDIAVAVVDGTRQFELSIPCNIFGVDRSSLTPDWYGFRLCAVGPGPVRTTGGLLLDTVYGAGDLVTADTVIVTEATQEPGRHPELIEALRAAHRRGARIASLCSGAFFLAEAGLLDGRRATTHWAHAADLAAQYPAITVDPGVLYVQDGNIFTSAGSAAGIDLCLHLVRLDFGSAVANAIARRMVVPPHRDGGQRQYIDAPLPPAGADGLGPVLDWALVHLAEPLTLADLARAAHVSTRTLARRFEEAAGATPLQWLLQQRVRRAQHLLESTDEPVERVASLCGLGSAANLRQHFTRAVGVPPASYRRTFRHGSHEPDSG
jgi:transcriptional regulator GlxA family with amidase domain